MAFNTAHQILCQMLANQGMQPFAFQEATWHKMAEGQSGIVNAPTGCGKTYAVFLGTLLRFIAANPLHWKTSKKNGLQLLWITPLRALATDICRAMEDVLQALALPWEVGVRNGDTSTNERAKQKRAMPEILIITPESLHLLLATKDHPTYFKTLSVIAVDEWHELLGSKRGVQVELAIAYLYQQIAQNLLIKENGSAAPPLIWGISATIGNLPEALQVLLQTTGKQGVIIKADVNKQIAVHSIIPNEIEKYPWAGHLGIRLIDQVIPIIEKSKTTLIFINTRGMAERWYQTLLEVAPQLAGVLALHHGSIEQSLRQWVEDALLTQKLKAVVTTASLDLGVDFRPVDTVIQVGSPKGVARFLQRAGRAGHAPGEISHIYFLPTHSLELIESVALQNAIIGGYIESKIPLQLCFDVLMQFLCTLAVGTGFYPNTLLPILQSTYCFAEITTQEWQAILYHLTVGGKALQQYDEYHKISVAEDGRYHIPGKRDAMRHRLSIGTIVSDAMLKVKFLTGGYIGHVEEWFVSRLDAGDVFTIAGQNVALVQIKDMTVLVRKSNQKKSIVPSWMGGRMSLTANLGHVLRQTFSQAAKLVQVLAEKENILLDDTNATPEIIALLPLLQLQAQYSHIPSADEMLVEHIEDKDGYHLMVYPFEGRQVHEALSAIIAYRLGKIIPISFSIAMNDYGFELLSDQPIPVDDSNVLDLFSSDHLLTDIQKSMNSVEMASRRFRDIAVIGGLVFQGMPGEQKKARHLQSSSSLLFKVFREFDADNILLRQAFQEVFEQQMEEVRLRQALQRIQQSKIIILWPQKLTPLSFPIIADGLNRNNLSTEKLEDRIKKMQLLLNA